MTATEVLRRLLDERGVKWVDTGDGSTLIPEQTATNVAWDVNTWPSGKDMGDCLWVQNRHPLTPEQAISATLGSGTIEKAAERIEVLSGLAREYLHRYGMLMSMAGEDVTDEVLAMESVINEVCGKKVVDE